MSKIKLTVTEPIVDGLEVKFRAPCACTSVDGITAEYTDPSGVATTKTFVFRDAHGNDIGSIDDLFVANTLLKVMLDVTNSAAYFMNADTNQYLEDVHSGFAKTSIKETSTIGTAWTGSSIPYTQKISLNGISSTSVVEVSLRSTATAAQVKAYNKLCLQDGGQGSGYITLRCFGEKNTVSIPINVIVRRD